MSRIGRARPVSNYRPRTAKPYVPADASITGTATLTAAAVRSAPADASITGTATLTAAAQRSANVAATSTLTATLTADMATGPTVDASSTLTGTLTAAFHRTAGVDATLTGTATLTAAAASATTIAATSTLTATLTADFVTTRPVDATATLTATLTAAMGTYAEAPTSTLTGTRTASMIRTGAGVKTAQALTTLTATATAAMGRRTPVDASTALTGTLTAGMAGVLHAAANSSTLTATLRASMHIVGAPEPVTPPERTQRITAEDRTLVICAENRTQRILAEPRRLHARLAAEELVLPPGIVLPGPPASKLAFNDSFGRGSLGVSWLVGANAPIIASNQVRAGSSGPNSATTYYPALWSTPTGTNDVEATAVVVTAGVNPDSSLGSGLIVRGNTGFDRVEMIATTTTVAIVTVIGGTRTVRQTVAVSVPNVVTIRFDAAGHTYRAYIGSSATLPAVVWVDSGHLIAIDATTRLTGIVCSSAKDGSGTASYGWELDDWTGKDL
ncbi:hypothetical protein [Nocardia sp. NBC_00511]|uniref:hypothetical protein n=1 Tax=Nocardia sp. NBC_00511 TaxID=2903591 RepID=UPI0030E31BA1